MNRPAPTSVPFDSAALKASFAAVAEHGDDIAMHFYSSLFAAHPEARQLFPTSMSGQRDRFLGALVRIVTDVDRIAELAPYLAELGRDHRKFGALAGHYPAIGEALIATIEHFSGAGWNKELEATWVRAYNVIAGTMMAGAERAAAIEPPWYEGEIVDVDRRSFDLAVVRVRTTLVVPYLAGQSMSVQACTLRPRHWRPFTPATAPGGLEFELHVRAIDGGTVSTALVRAAAPGDELRLGPAFGRMTLDPMSTRPVLMIAGGTGLAPMKAMIQQLARQGGRPTHLYFGARTEREVYDRQELLALATAHDWLHTVVATSDDTRWTGPHGLIGDVVAVDGDFTGHDAYVCGSPPMVEHSLKVLVAQGMPESQIRFEEFGKA